jgi:hypothetical protein
MTAKRTARRTLRTTCPNSTAEAITETPGGDLDNRAGLADIETVFYINAVAGLSGLNYGTPLGPLPGLTKSP